MNVIFSFYPTIAAISIWFDRRRGLALGIAVAGSSLGAIFWSMILQYLLDHVGFGWTVRASGFISLGILLPASLLVVERPKEERDAPTPINWKGIMTQAPFIVFSVGMMLVLWGMFIPFFYLPSYGEHNGLPASAANDLLAYLNAGSFAGRLLTGLLADRTGRFNTISLASLCCTVLLYCLHVMETSSSIIAFSVLYGVASGGLISLQPACVAEITPNKDILGVKIGLMMALCSAG
ncbi:uncharacterized protein N7459_007054 [Penicillium hispanicum]|uniref:uncharacterized protein n=1 Tax=Penicillium hispanicum TaxID=1080232 RepID=UPI002541EC4B|nr:uncharacterized protein N7459_007054 [Penicillium hispanicum]KAJ5578090.1 hypothetical protein N7459_007054 [Penicillium hispanicum]